MNGKPVVFTKTRIINFDSGFSHKLLCDGPTFTTGSACAYSCQFCYVPNLMARNPQAIDAMKRAGASYEEIVIRRANPIDTMREQLVDSKGRPKFDDVFDNRVIYASPLVDVAANMELVRETIEACKLVMNLTHWHVRLLSKSNLLPKVAEALEAHKDRIIYGLSTGTLDDVAAKSFEQGTPLVSKRLEALHQLQDNGFRTFGMICPSLPQKNYKKFATDICAAIRHEKCEHVWGEVLNVRGASMTRTVKALRDGGSSESADMLEATADQEVWEQYARNTFLNLAMIIPGNKFRFLQYETEKTREWWLSHKNDGAIALRAAGH